MSNDAGMDIWVGDLDGYVDLDAIEAANRAEDAALYLDLELTKLGDLQLLAGKAISARVLDGAGVSPSNWRFAVHQAERTLTESQVWPELQRSFIKELLSLGRLYAVSRYSKWEKVSYSCAITATFPHGLKALVSQFLTAQGISGNASIRDDIRSSLERAGKAVGLTAYQRTSTLQSAIYRAADRAPAHAGHQSLSREGMRTMLSLTRLHFSIAELNVSSLDEIERLFDMYKMARRDAENWDRAGVGIGRHIPNWQLRHLHPLTDLYPYSVRHALKRASLHVGTDAAIPDRSTILNELALARCGIERMRKAGRVRARSK